ncbi:MAG: ABC transporter permease subunit [bacterium]
MKKVWLPIVAIAGNSYREALRNKMLGTFGLFAPVLLGLSSLLGAMSVGHEARVATDASLWLSTLFGVAIAIYASITLFHAEIERRTIYTLLTKPIARWQFVVGKYVGVSLLCLTVTLVCFGVSAAVIVSAGGEVTPTTAAAYGTLFLQLLIVTSIAILLASFSSSLLSGLVTTGVFVAGSLNSQLEAARNSLRDSAPGAKYVIETALIVLPDFQSLNLSTESTYNVSIPFDFVLNATWYATSYVALTLVATVFIMSRRDFT